VSWGDNECGQNATARAIRLGETQLLRDLSAHPGHAPWREAWRATGNQAALGLPLRLARGGPPFGSLALASTDAQAFDPGEVRLLEELAGDLGYGIANLRADAERRAAESRLEYLAYHDPVTGL